MTTLHLTPDQLLSTTRTVRKRLDLTRPVERALLDECFDLAFQAPTGGGLQGWHFVVVSARARGLGTAWTSLHLEYEREAAAILGIPYERFMQVALIPVAHTIGTHFKRGPRLDMNERVHWDSW